MSWAEWGRRISTFTAISLVVAAGLLIGIQTVIFLTQPDRYLTDLKWFTYSLGGYSFRVEDFRDFDSLKFFSSILIGTFFVINGFTFILVLYLRRFFASVSENTPIDLPFCRRLNILAWVSIVFGLSETVTSNWGALLFAGVLKPASVTPFAGTFYWSINVYWIFTGLLLGTFASFFKKLAQKSKEADQMPNSNS